MLCGTCENNFNSTNLHESVQMQSFFWFVFSCIQTEYGDLRSRSSYSVQIQENTDQKKLCIWTIFTQCNVKRILNCAWFRLLRDIRDLQKIAVYVNDNQSSVLTYSETILFSVGICLFKVNNNNTRKQSEICPKLTKKDTRTMSIDTSTQLVDVTQVFFFLTLNIFCFFFYCIFFFLFILYVNFELVNVSWEFCSYVLIIMQSLNIV